MCMYIYNFTVVVFFFVQALEIEGETRVRRARSGYRLVFLIVSFKIEWCIH